MEPFVIQMCQKEGHFSFYENRKTIWENFESKNLSTVCQKLTDVYKELYEKWNKKTDRSLRFRLDWNIALRELSDKYCEAEESVDVRIIMNTVAKYVLKFLQRETDPIVVNDLGQHNILPPQSDAGISVLAGGVLGKMFKMKQKQKQISIRTEGYVPFDSC